MLNSASITYQMKRKILTFSNKISRHLSKPEKKFTADITYGILASGSCLLTDIAEACVLTRSNHPVSIFPEYTQDYVIRVARIYFSRWKIEEYFRCKKQIFRFE